MSTLDNKPRQYHEDHIGMCHFLTFHLRRSNS
jgi:hypothetical protein